MVITKRRFMTESKYANFKLLDYPQLQDYRKKQFYQFNDEVVTAISSLQIHKPTADEKLPRYACQLETLQ